MLTDYEIHASLATRDIAAARTWYAEKLGLEPFTAFPGLLAYQVGPTMFTVFETPSAGTAENTVAVWRVPDLRTEVARLRDRGVVFEAVDDGPEDRTIDGIMATVDPEGSPVLNAWFRDGDGNWISLVEQADHPDRPPAGFGIGPSLAAADVARARAWYAERLGLEPVTVYKGEELVYRQGKTRFTVFRTPAAGSAKNTVAVWRVADLRAEVATLRQRGLGFEDYDFDGAGTVDGVYANPDDGSLAAWFVDSEGNTLGLVEDAGEPIRPR
jgi:catechol 2,3-dioxygenase-like lactoylglutathione lyase family enzyme